MFFDAFLRALQFVLFGRMGMADATGMTYAQAKSDSGFHTWQQIIAKPYNPLTPPIPSEYRD